MSAGGIATDPTKVEVVEKWPTPFTVAELRSFLGFSGYYRAFVKDYATLAAPLYHLTKQGIPYDWTLGCQSAFEALKETLSRAPVLAFPAEEGALVLDTDASDMGLGAVLSQVQPDGVERVLNFASRSLSKPERNYCVTRRELLAIVYAIRKFRHFLGEEVVIRTDHNALQWLLNFKEPEGQMARWLLELSSYNLVIQHRPGKLHGNADGLSRRPCRQCGLVEGDPEMLKAINTIGEERGKPVPEQYKEVRVIQRHPRRRSIKIQQQAIPGMDRLIREPPSGDRYRGGTPS